MTTLIETQDPQAREAELVAWAATFGPVLAEHGTPRCRGSWVQESFEQLRDAGFLASQCRRARWYGRRSARRRW